MAVIEAGVGGTSWWDGPFHAACFYFTDESLSIALGQDIPLGGHRERSVMGFRSVRIRRLFETLVADAAASQPHGALVGDAAFVALASILVMDGKVWSCRARPGTPDWRVRRALEYVHAHLISPMTIPEIATAASTSPFYLNRQFREVMGTSLWRYILDERARRPRSDA